LNNQQNENIVSDFLGEKFCLFFTKKLGKILDFFPPSVCTPTTCAKFLEKSAKFLISQNWGGKLKTHHAHNNMGGIQSLLLLIY
jgi:hypothetical protein